jgi:hypothetical protein
MTSRRLAGRADSGLGFTVRLVTSWFVTSRLMGASPAVAVASVHRHIGPVAQKSAPVPDVDVPILTLSCPVFDRIGTR